MTDTCNLCGKSIDIGEKFVIDGIYPSITTTFPRMYFMSVFNLFRRIKSITKGKIYHRECFIKNLKFLSK